MSHRILVTPRSVTRAGHPSLDLLRDAGCEVIFCKPGVQPSEDDLRALLPGCSGYLAGVEPVTAAVLESAPSLRAISRNGTGVDNIDTAAAAARGIAVLRAEGANARGVAELAIGLLFSLARRIPACDAALKCGAWERGGAGFELEGRTLGIVGCGRVGRLTAGMASGLGMNVIASDPYPDLPFKPGPQFRYAAFEEVAALADVLTLHCPPAADGNPVITRAVLKTMKPGALLLNTARYDLMDPEAVADALDDGTLGGLGLDVFDAEPPVDFRLSAHPRVIATPHLGGFTGESIDRAMTAAVRNLLHALGLKS